MGHSMEDKVLKPLLHRKLKDKSLRKPLLVRLSTSDCIFGLRRSDMDGVSDTVVPLNKLRGHV
jgi:hypothetical protein